MKIMNDMVDVMPLLRDEVEPQVLLHAVKRLDELPENSLVSREVAAAALGVSPGTLANWASREKRSKATGVPLRVIRLGSGPKARVRYRVGDILNLISGKPETGASS